MRNCHRVLGAIAVLLISAPAAHATSAGAVEGRGVSPRTDALSRPAVPLPWGDSLTVDRTGYVNRGGDVTVYGTYRCVYDTVDSPRASILVTLTQGAERDTIGSAPAICDGQQHRWAVNGTGGAYYVGGAAYAEARMVKYGDRGDFVPMPRTVADTEHSITLVNGMR
ncbi:DUF6299 family protein [Streptomyces sp. NPDC048636]|uniref:DUF6299 family protein n=1 Tax=Streptomyces sp. NPDC048636 TaxID=3155762 RepID=UPI0034197354